MLGLAGFSAKLPNVGPRYASRSEEVGAELWRSKAEKARSKARDAKAPRIRRRMLGLAASYDQLADQVEQRRITEPHSCDGC